MLWLQYLAVVGGLAAVCLWDPVIGGVVILALLQVMRRTWNTPR